jgi:hypothetical protein
VGHLRALARSLRSRRTVGQQLTPVYSADHQLRLTDPHSRLAAFKGLYCAFLFSTFFWEFIVYLFIWQRR